MDEEALIGYQLQRYHHIQNQAAKILGLILTAISTTIALAGAVVLEIISLPSSASNLISTVVGEEFTSATLVFNSLMTFFIATIFFSIAIYIYAMILSDSSISPNVQPISEIGLKSGSDQVTVISNKIGIKKIEELWTKSSKHMVIAIISLFLGLISIIYSSTTNQWIDLLIHVGYISIPIVAVIGTYINQDNQESTFKSITIQDIEMIYIISILIYLLIFFVSLISVVSVIFPI